MSSARRQPTSIVSVIFPLGHEQDQPLSDPFFLQFIGHIADRLAKSGMRTMLVREQDPVGDWLITEWDRGHSDGLLVIGQSTQHHALNAAAGSGIPFIVWGAQQRDQRYPTVGVDNFAGARTATHHLFVSGRRRIAFVGGGDAPEFLQRFLGYEAALRAAELPVDDQLHIQTHLSGDGLAAPLMRRLGSHVIDGVVCASDAIAIEVIGALQREGVNVPDDIAVVGFDDIMAASLTTPSLTTVRQDLAAAADAMVERLLARMQGGSATSLILPTELVVRQSAP